ncbi:MAG: protein kinase, partial [Isosphaeraceae bacterium]|nr:protein kinase [Isosphaeraceae bacterium]
MSFCPSDDQLERLLEGKLEDDALAVVVMHLETCAECRGVLEELTRDHLALARWRPALEVTAGCDDSEVFETTEYLTDPGAPAVRPSSRSHPDARRSRAARRSEPAGRLPGGEGDDEDWPVLEGYEILAKLGQGGMGVVYKARQRRLDRLVALKMIRAGDQERPEHRARFRLEAEAAARLRHAQIVQVYDIGECDGRLFCALELLEGGSLETRIAGMPQPERAAAKLLATLAAAIHAAHRAGIVHRDLKSSNVLFTTDGTPKITDFGLAKRLDEEEGHTQTGQVIGSPSFMAPEQARGHNREVGPAADIYALGAILYEMLTGRPPFRGATPMETMIQVVHEDPVPPSRLRPRLSRDLETICLKCLQKEPARRYPTAQALADDLRRYLDGQPILARPISIRERAWKWARREPAQAALVALGLVAVIITVAAGVRLQQERKREERRLADLRDEGRDALSEARAAWREQDWITGHTALARLLAKVEKEPRLTALKNEALRLRAQIQRASADEQQRQLARERYREFVRLREEALYYDTRFSGLDPAGNLAATREAARKALAVFDGGTAPPEALSRAERADLQEGCYELLLVLARAVAQPRPGEDRQKQAAAALRLLDRAAALRTPERAYHLYRADCLAGAGDEPAAARAPRAAAPRQPPSAFD